MCYILIEHYASWLLLYKLTASINIFTATTGTPKASDIKSFMFRLNTLTASTLNHDLHSIIALNASISTPLAWASPLTDLGSI